MWVRNIWNTHLSNTPKLKGLKKRKGKKALPCDLKPFRLAIYPPRLPFLLFPCSLPAGCAGRDGCFFLSDFSFASELGTGIITCLYDQLPDYSPEMHKMSEEQSRGLCCGGGQADCTQKQTCVYTMHAYTLPIGCPPYLLLRPHMTDSHTHRHTHQGSHSLYVLQATKQLTKSRTH